MQDGLDVSGFSGLERCTRSPSGSYQKRAYPGE